MRIEYPFISIAAGNCQAERIERVLHKIKNVAPLFPPIGLRMKAEFPLEMEVIRDEVFPALGVAVSEL